MKKYLLFAVATLIVGSVSAQKIGKKTNTSAKKSSTTFVANKFKKAQFGTINMIPQLRENTPIMTINGEKIVKAENKKFTKSSIASRRALATAYDGTCGGSEGSQKWTMTPVTLKNEKEEEFPGFEDLLPNVFNGVEHTYVEYTINGTAITIKPQYLLTVTSSNGSKYDIWLANWTSSSVDGVIDMTLTEDGELTMGPAYVAYAAFPADTKTFSYEETLGSWAYFQSIKYKDATAINAPTVSYTSEDAIFYSGITSDGYSFIHQHVLLPAYSPVSFTNLTTDNADAWSWKAYTMGYEAGATEEDDGTFFNDKLVAEADTRDFTFTTEGGITYASPILVGSYQGIASDPYTGFNDTENGLALAYAGSTASDWVFSDGSAPIVSRADTKNGLSGIVSAGSTSRYSALVFYQGKPAAPFYFEGVNMFILNFVKVADIVDLKCKIYKVERNESGVPSLGELVAESDLDQTSLETSSWNNIAQLKWNKFKTIDETGTVFNMDYFFVDYDFAIVVDGWNNGTFTGNCIGDEGDANCTISNTSVILASNGRESGLAYYGHAFVGFDGASYGYLYTEDNTNMTIPTEGGKAAINVKPMLYGIDSESGDYITRLFFKEAVTDTDADEDYDEDGFPVWLKVSYTNPVKTGTDEDEQPIYDMTFALTFEAEALPAGVSGRQANLVFFQEGALLKVTVTQGEVSGIAATKVEVKSGNAQMYNLAGQRVSKDFKGLVIKNNRKFMNK